MRVVGEAEIIIAAEADDVFIIDKDLDLLWAADDAACAVTVLPFFFFECLAEVFQVKSRKLAAGAG